MNASARPGPPSSRQLRWRAGLGVRADPLSWNRIYSFQPCYALVLALQTDKNQRGRLDGGGAAVTGRTKYAALSVIMLRVGRSRMRIRGGRHFRTDRRRIERIGCGVSDHAKCRDRRKQLHQYREQHDWNKDFQPPSHDYPQTAQRVLPLASPLVEIACDTIAIHASVGASAGHVSLTKGRVITERLVAAARCQVISKLIRPRSGACPRTIETHESVEPRRYLEPPPSHGTQSMDEVSAPLTCLREKRGRAFTIIVYSRRFRPPKGKCIAGLKK